MSVIGCPFWNTRNKVGAASMQVGDWGCTGTVAEEVAEDKRSGKYRLISSLCELDVLRILCQQKSVPLRGELKMWKGLWGSSAIRQGDLIYLSPCSKGASAFSVVLHILRVFPAPTLSFGKLLLLAQLLSWFTLPQHPIHPQRSALKEKWGKIWIGTETRVSGKWSGFQGLP